PKKVTKKKTEVVAEKPAAKAKAADEKPEKKEEVESPATPVTEKEVPVASTPVDRPEEPVIETPAPATEEAAPAVADEKQPDTTAAGKTPEENAENLSITNIRAEKLEGPKILGKITLPVDS